ncbi:unnamed protein product [Rodentolepis nana]|uniref:BZIP domain-containing protein n=1 Tax=Rodentolepis nana TaxID=102285 RepID=A0A0R3TQ56_RODNA|nr:unnamed protein product [Rodentolepis nana]
MSTVSCRKHKSVAALTARQYREAKKKELLTLKSEVISLRKDVEFYRTLYRLKEKELVTLREKCAHLEEVAKASIPSYEDPRLASVPSLSSLSPDTIFDIESEPYVDNILDPFDAICYATKSHCIWNSSLTQNLCIYWTLCEPFILNCILLKGNIPAGFGTWTVCHLYLTVCLAQVVLVS